MGWDAFSSVLDHNLPIFKLVADKVKQKCGSVDDLLQSGGLDCSVCAYVLEIATGESAWNEDGWNAEKVKYLYENAKWPENGYDCWAVESAKEFLNVCAKLGLEIHFSY